MSDFTHLLADLAVTEAIHAHVGARSDHKVVGLHDEVLVRDEVVTTTSPFDASGAYIGPRRIVDYVETPTVEVVLVTMTGRAYAQRYRGSLIDFLAAAGVIKEIKAS